MDFVRFLDTLLHSRHFSSRHKAMLADFLEERNKKGLPLGDAIAWKGTQQMLEDLFSLVIHKAPDLMPRFLLATSTKGWAIGHAVARYKDAQGIAYFLETVHQQAPECFDQVTHLKSNMGWNMGHIIARFKGPEELATFFKYVLKYSPESFAELVTVTLDGGRSIGHLIAEYQNPQTFMWFIQLVSTYAPQELPGILGSSMMPGWGLGYFIAENQNQETLEYFINLVSQHAPQALPGLLKERTIDGWNLGHMIAEHPEKCRLSYYLDLVIKHAPESLAEVLNTRTKNMTILDIVAYKQKGNLGAFTYQLVTSNCAIGDKLLERLHEYKFAVLEHISRLPPQVQLQALNNALDKKTPLGLYFSLNKNGLLAHLHLGTVSVMLETIERLKIEAKARLASATPVAYATPHADALLAYSPKHSLFTPAVSDAHLEKLPPENGYTY